MYMHDIYIYIYIYICICIYIYIYIYSNATRIPPDKKMEAWMMGGREAGRDDSGGPLG
jgi:hypothetical protein